jgi:hypothetical protein
VTDETVNLDALEGVAEENPSASIDLTQARIAAPAEPRTAAEKVMRTLRDMSVPDADAGELELTLATVAMGLEKGLGPELAEHQQSGAVDEFVLALTRFIAGHRSESAKQLIVLELPRGRELPAGTRLHLLDDAIAAAETASSPL